jgi:glycine oxidase
MYVVQRSNGFTIAGSSEEQLGFDRSIDASICDDIHRRAAELVPALAGMTPAKRWIGFRPRSAEGRRPHIERVSGTNVWLAYGHYRNGILLAPLTAQRVAREIIGNARKAFSTER